MDSFELNKSYLDENGDVVKDSNINANKVKQFVIQFGKERHHKDNAKIYLEFENDYDTSETFFFGEESENLGIFAGGRAIFNSDYKLVQSGKDTGIYIAFPYSTCYVDLFSENEIRILTNFTSTKSYSTASYRLEILLSKIKKKNFPQL